MRPGETRSAGDVQDMLAEIFLAAGSSVLRGVGPKEQAKQSPARVDRGTIRAASSGEPFPMRRSEFPDMVSGIRAERARKDAALSPRIKAYLESTGKRPERSEPFQHETVNQPKAPFNSLQGQKNHRADVLNELKLYRLALRSPDYTAEQKQAFDGRIRMMNNELTFIESEIARLGQ